MNDKKNITKKVLKAAKKEFIAKFIFSILIRGCLLLLPVLLSNIIDNVTTGNIHIAYIMVIISLVVTIIERVGEYYNQVTYYNLYNKIYNGYSEAALRSTHFNSIFSLSRFSLGEYTNIMNTDIDVMSAFFSNAVIRIVQILEFIVIYVYFFYLNVYLFLITVIISIIILVVLLLCGKKIQFANRNQKEELDKKTSLIHETFLGIKEIKGFHVFDKVNNRVQAGTSNYLKATKKYNLLFNFIQIFSLLSIEIVRLLLIAYSIYEITQGRMEIGVLLIIYNYYTKIIDNFSMISSVNVEFRTLTVSLNRFHKIMEYSREVKEIKETEEMDYKGEICFNNILYGYRDDPILNDTTFTIHPNTLTIITGKAGSGKTGIFDLLLRYNEQHEGSIKIDNVNIKDINGMTYNKLVSLVRKQPAFFQISIKDNLMMIENDFNKVIEICQKLNIHDRILETKDGYDTIIDTKTNNISSNLKQLLAIARVILADTKIMLFDETLSVLDMKDQEIVIKVLKELASNHTIVLISREKDILKYADEVILIEKGKVKLCGTKKELDKDKHISTILFESL